MPLKSSRKLSAAKKISSLLDDYQPQILEIRKIIFRSVLSFIFGGAIGLIFNQKIIVWLISLFDLQHVNIVLTSPYQFFNLAVGLAVTIGVLTTIPVFVFYFLRFIRSALTDDEYVFIKKLLPVSFLLFVFGCLFGAKIEQFVISLYSQTSTDYSLSNIWDIGSFLSQVLIMSLTMGFVFQLPIILTILIKTKIINTHMLASQRRYVYAALTLFGVILPPTDVLSLFMIITPLFLLFEGTLLLNRAK